MSRQSHVRIGHKMIQAIQLVSANPGCNKLFVSLRVGPNGSSKFGYAIVDRCIEHGLLEATITSKGYRLTITSKGERALSGEPVEA